jgi:folate-binding protein YgfZ
LMQATAEDFRAFRIDHFHPRFGEDFTSSTLPQETGLTHALHFQKGCYLGQEIVERIRSRGHVNRMLIGLTLEKEESFPVGTPVGTKLHFNSEEVGQITSIHRDRAIAMVRIQGSKPGTVLQIGDVNATVAAVS